MFSRATAALALARRSALPLAAAIALLPGVRAEAAVRVVATVFPVADLVRQVAGPDAEVITLLPPGASPHTFDPTPSAVRAVAESRVCFMVGGGLEEWALKLVEAAGRPGVRLVDLSEGVPLIREVAGEEAERALRGAALGQDPEDPAGRAHGRGANPHYWLDPVLAIGMVDRIEVALAAALPSAAAGLASRAAALRGRLRELDAEIRAAAGSFRSRRLVTFHNAWPYFARRYGLVVEGVIEVAPGREPGPRHLALIVARIRSFAVPAVFAEPQFPPRAAEAIAREAGVRVLTLDPIGGVPPERASYLDLMRYNLRELERGLR